MGYVCEHEFNREDPKNPGYSMLEYDLYARLNMTLRKNLKTNKYEIVKISTKQVVYSYRDLKDIVRMANQLEGAENTVIRCHSSCPNNRRK